MDLIYLRSKLVEARNLSFNYFFPPFAADSSMKLAPTIGQINAVLSIVDPLLIYTRSFLLVLSFG